MNHGQWCNKTCTFCRKRLQDLAENLQQMEEAREQLAKQHQQQLQQQRFLQSTRFVVTLIIVNANVAKKYSRNSSKNLRNQLILPKLPCMESVVLSA